jgi:hypothetical protein
MPMPAVRALEQIGPQCRCATSGQVPEHPQLVLTQLEQRQQGGEKSAQDAAQRQSLVGGLPAALPQGTGCVHVSAPRRMGSAQGPALAFSARGGWCR